MRCRLYLLATTVTFFPRDCLPATLQPTSLPSEFPTSLPSATPSRLPSPTPTFQPTLTPVHPPTPGPTETRLPNPRGGALQDSVVYVTAITNGVKKLSTEDTEQLRQEGFQSTAERVDDTPMGRIKLKFPFPYGGKRFRHAYVNANGGLFFEPSPPCDAFFFGREKLRLR